jgi:hypothetical protein
MQTEGTTHFTDRLADFVVGQGIELEFKESIAPALGMSYVRRDSFTAGPVFWRGVANIKVILGTSPPPPINGIEAYGAANNRLPRK